MALSLSEKDLLELEPEVQVDLMIEWFRDRYEDPVHELPYNSREGGYQWINGGPFHAQDVLEGNFGSVVSYETIMNAVEELERESWEWTPKRDQDEVYFPADVVDELGETPPTVLTPIEQPDFHDAKKALYENLDNLAEQTKKLSSRPTMGHNNPPSSIDDAPLNDEDWAAITSAKENIVAQVEAGDAASLRSTFNSLRLAASKIGGWLAKKADLAADTFVKVVATGLAGGAVIEIVGLREKILQTLESLLTVLNSII